mmetsp:Transcript_27482/g.61544  ORF Transcript_27482/g.61544 Transcript_27482/m.61544 type:complete len:207 (+) Transcript_27482:113-733(+)
MCSPGVPSGGLESLVHVHQGEAGALRSGGGEGHAEGQVLHRAHQALQPGPSQQHALQFSLVHGADGLRDDVLGAPGNSGEQIIQALSLAVFAVLAVPAFFAVRVSPHGSPIHLISGGSALSALVSGERGSNNPNRGGDTSDGICQRDGSSGDSGGNSGCSGVVLLVFRLAVHPVLVRLALQEQREHAREQHRPHLLAGEAAVDRIV